MKALHNHIRLFIGLYTVLNKIRFTCSQKEFFMDGLQVLKNSQNYLHAQILDLVILVRINDLYMFFHLRENGG